MALQLPNLDQAFVPGDKIHGYLLAPEHPVGRYKAAFFARLGYARDCCDLLQKDILELARGHVVMSDVTAYGTKYLLRGTLTGPNGVSATVVTIWIVLNDDTVPRFVTAYPEG